MKNHSVCLNMIVKNEKPVIERCLSSVKCIIDYWVIVDTGSSDGTQDAVREIMRGIPGELYERPWVNFEHNRNEALALAKGHGDYLLLIDADDKLVFRNGERLPKLTDDAYLAEQHHGGCISPFILLINQRFDWKWEGKVHERVVCAAAKKRTWLEGAYLQIFYEGNRSKDLKQKYLRDAETLESYLPEDPMNSRNLFHIAVCLESADQLERALPYYEKRLAHPDDNMERFFSQYRIGVLQEQLKHSPEIFLKSYLSAHQMEPSRAEPLFSLTNYFMSIRCYWLGYLLAKEALQNCRIENWFYVISYIYDYGLLDQLAECAYRIGKYQEASDALHQMLSVQNLPQDVRMAAKKNLDLLKRHAFNS